MSPGLKRARAPFRVRNAITGTLIAAFAIGVWAYSISAVKQDNFDDVDEEAKALARSRVKSIGDKERTQAARTTTISSSNSEGLASSTEEMDRLPAQHSSTTSTSFTNGRGVLASILDSRFPRLLDPERKTIIWGAPPVDRIGSMRDKRN